MKGKKSAIQILGLLLIVVIFGYLFLYPSVTQQTLTLFIDGSNFQSAKINSMKLGYVNKPALSIFSRSNPSGDLTLELNILDENGNTVLYGKILNVGLGESTFESTGIIVSPESRAMPRVVKVWAWTPWVLSTNKIDPSTALSARDTS